MFCQGWSQYLEEKTLLPSPPIYSPASVTTPKWTGEGVYLLSRYSACQMMRLFLNGVEVLNVSNWCIWMSLLTSYHHDETKRQEKQRRKWDQPVCSGLVLVKSRPNLTGIDLLSQMPFNIIAARNHCAKKVIKFWSTIPPGVLRRLWKQQKSMVLVQSGLLGNKREKIMWSAKRQWAGNK